MHSSQDHVTIAYDLVESNRMDSALYHLDQALEKDPDNLAAYLLRGWIQQYEKRLDEALISYDAVLERDPLNISGHYYRSTVWLDLDKPFSALQDMQTAMEIRSPGWTQGKNSFVLEPVANPWLGLEVPEFHVAYNDLAYNFAMIHLRLDNADKALEWLNHCVDKRHRLSDVLYARGILFHMHEMTNEACADLERAALMWDKTAAHQWRSSCAGLTDN